MAHGLHNEKGMCPACCAKCRAVGSSKRGGGGHVVGSVVDIVCPPPIFEIGLTDLPKSGVGGHVPPGSYGPDMCILFKEVRDI